MTLAVERPRRAGPLAIEPDYDALGPKEYPQSRFPRAAALMSLPIAPSFIGQITLPGDMSADEWDRLIRVLDAFRTALVVEWPAAVSDGLTLPCTDCGEVPRFDYRVKPEFWARWVQGPERLGVVCLPCLDKRSEGVGLADALVEVQWTGTGHTVVSRPVLRQEYPPVSER